MAWNQKVPNGNFEEGVLHWAKSGGTIAASNNEMVWTVNNGQAIYNSTCNDFISGHKYIGIAVVKAAKTFQFGLAGQHSDFQGSDSYQTIKKYVTSAVNGNTIYFYPVSSIEGSEKNTEMRFKSVACFDLTLMFGAGNEPATVEEFEALFPLPYYAYNAGTLISNKAKAIEFVEFNQWDEEWEAGSISSTTGQNTDVANYIRCKNYFPVFPNQEYYSCGKSYPRYYDANKNFIGYSNSVTNQTFTTPVGAAYMRIVMQGTTYNHDICINLSGKRNGQYEPYKKVVLPLPNLDQIKVYSHNIWDEEWEVGTIDNDGQPAPSSLVIRSKKFIPVFPNTDYYKKSGIALPTDTHFLQYYYDADKNFISAGAWGPTFTTPANCHFIKLKGDTTYGNTYANDICINLSSSFNGQYEPHGILTMEGGLKSAGSVRDEIVGNKFVKKVGRVDLGSVDFSYNASNALFSKYGAIPIKAGSVNLICAKYKISGGIHYLDFEDKMIGLGNNTDSVSLFVKDTAYTDAATFKSAMSGVMLDYELATPIEYELYSPTKMPFNWKYRVSEYHTKKMLPENGENPTSAPFACEIKQC